MVQCCVPNCKSSSSQVSKQESGVGFHRFPKNEEKISLWASLVNREDWEPNAHSRICSLHFTEESFYITDEGFRKLNHSALPTLHLPESVVKCKPSAALLKATEWNPDVRLERHDSAHTRKLKQRVIHLEQLKHSHTRRIRTLHQRVRRLKSKLTLAKRVILYFKNKLPHK